MQHYDVQGAITARAERRAYRASSRLRTDSCEIDARDLQNESYRDRMTFYSMLHDHAAPCDDPSGASASGAGGYVPMREISDFSTDNLLTLDAGATRVRPECVDTESHLRYGLPWMCASERKPLAKRLFTAVPDLYRGHVDLEVESKLVQGEHGVRQPADRGRSLYHAQRMPMLDCLARSIQDPDHIVMAGPRGGEPTRESCVAESR